MLAIRMLVFVALSLCPLQRNLSVALVLSDLFNIQSKCKFGCAFYLIDYLQ